MLTITTDLNIWLIDVPREWSTVPRKLHMYNAINARPLVHEWKNNTPEIQQLIDFLFSEESILTNCQICKLLSRRGGCVAAPNEDYNLNICIESALTCTLDGDLFEIWLEYRPEFGAALVDGCELK